MKLMVKIEDLSFLKGVIEQIKESKIIETHPNVVIEIEVGKTSW